MNRTRIVVVDDQPLYRLGLRAALGAVPDFVVAGEPTCEGDVLEHIRALIPDVVVLGELHGAWDVVASALYRSAVTGAGGLAGLVLLLDSVSEEDLFYSLKVGASAIRRRACSREALVEVVRGAARGDCAIALAHASTQSASRRLLAQAEIVPDLLPGSAPPPCPLSPRELDVLVSIAEGATNKEIGHRFSISAQTVKNHVTAVLRKLQVGDRTEAVAIAYHNNWLPQSSGSAEAVANQSHAA
ncbi:MAG: response regulator transcription factor [Chloroflexi bacterium]|nr:response regulator transcription factor [Chloroflexota bacterium]